MLPRMQEPKEKIGGGVKPINLTEAGKKKLRSYLRRLGDHSAHGFLKEAASQSLCFACMPEPKRNSCLTYASTAMPQALKTALKQFQTICISAAK